MSHTRVLPAGLLLVFTAATAAPQEHAHPQGAERLGTVHFATSCSPAVAPEFNRSVALLHSFEFASAIRGFNSVLAADSSCAMAYWGIALSRWTNPFLAGTRSPAQLKPGREAADNAMRIASRATDRERGYIAAVTQLYADFEKVDQRTRVVGYERAMAALADQQPQDLEAKVFYALALASSALPSDKTYANQLKAGGILEPIFAANPDHPGLAHYIIHSYDVPPLAPKAKAAAQRYSEIAPSAAHALHMPSHTFTRVGMWEESIKTNLLSKETADRAGSIGEVLHAADYAMYAYLQLGRDSAARALLNEIPGIFARLDINAIGGAAAGSAGVFANAAMPSRWALERGDWKAAAALEPKTSAFPYTDALMYFARALGASRTGETAKARSSIDSLAAIWNRLDAAREAYWSQQVTIQRLGAQAWLDLAEKRELDALMRMREAAALEDATEKSAVTPGPLAPARELLGDMLMELKRPAEALVEYQATLQKEPNRFRALYGAMQAASAAGDKAAAARHAAELKKLTATADKPGRSELQAIRRSTD